MSETVKIYERMAKFKVHYEEVQKLCEAQQYSLVLSLTNKGDVANVRFKSLDDHKFKPDIYFNEWCDCMEMQTTSYGSLGCKDLVVFTNFVKTASKLCRAIDKIIHS